MRILLPALLLLIAFWVYSIVDCALLPPTRHRGVSKPAWMLIIIALPVVGGILWFIVGRGRQRPQPASTAPDDNPAFLGSIGSISDQDERIRRLEAELAALDAESLDPDDFRIDSFGAGGAGTDKSEPDAPGAAESGASDDGDAAAPPTRD